MNSKESVNGVLVGGNFKGSLITATSKNQISYLLIRDVFTKRATQIYVVEAR